MSKMRMPEMSVVRFTESDVIVASIIFSNFQNKTQSDGTISKDGVTVYYGGHTSSFVDRINEFFPGAEYVIPSNPTSPSDRLLLNSLLDNDSSGIEADRYDGSYIWDESSHTFIHQ